MNAEVSLFDLLLALGQAGRSKRVLRRTGTEQSALRLDALLLVVWRGVAVLERGWPVTLALLGGALGWLGYLYAMALRTLVAVQSQSAMTLGMFVLLSLSVLLPHLWQDWDVSNAERAIDAISAAWLLLVLFLLWLGRRGWRALQQRRHPFLPN